MAVVIVTTTGKWTKAQRGIDTCKIGGLTQISEGCNILPCMTIVTSQILLFSPKIIKEALKKPGTTTLQHIRLQYTLMLDLLEGKETTFPSRPSQSWMKQRARTSGVKMERGTRVQKKPRLTQCVANFLIPKYRMIRSSFFCMGRLDAQMSTAALRHSCTGPQVQRCCCFRYAKKLAGSYSQRKCQDKTGRQSAYEVVKPIPKNKFMRCRRIQTHSH